MQWYLLRTWEGKEEELVREIRRNIPSYLYKECFVIYQERIWRKQQKSIVHTERLFPGCVFLTCEINRDEMEEVAGNNGLDGFGNSDNFRNLRLLPLMKEDAEFLEKLSGKEHLVKLSYVQRDKNGNICKLSEPLNGCREKIERMQLKKRYAMVHHRLWGEEKVIVLGILLGEDIGANLLYKDERKVLDTEAISTRRKGAAKEMA